MKNLVLATLLLLGSWGGLTRIRDRNAAVQQAEQAYARGNFALAAQAYHRAVEQLGGKDEALLLNLAHAYARAGQGAEARTYYGRLLTSRQPRVRSVARQQLAVLAAGQGNYAQAVSLLRQALLADPTNAQARYNYEALQQYLARHQDDEPQMPPPADEGAGAPDKQPTDPQSQANQPRPKRGADQPGQLDDPTQPEDPRNAPQARPDQRGQADPSRPAPTPGSTAPGGFRPGPGPQQAVARGTEPGSVRGLSDAATGPQAPGASHRAGSEAATLNETQLQTQRERLQQMNLSAGQAQQLLQALNAAEQQYLQQLPHPATRKPDSGKPAW